MNSTLDIPYGNHPGTASRHTLFLSPTFEENNLREAIIPVVVQIRLLELGHDVIVGDLHPPTCLVELVLYKSLVKQN